MPEPGDVSHEEEIRWLDLCRIRLFSIEGLE
jgi:hypothetical protein